jgi:hypothetical protein
MRRKENVEVKSNLDVSQEVIAPASPDSLLTLCYFENWLVGFTTAEGCFCIRQSGNHSFSISQNYDSVILEAIKCKFELPNKGKIKRFTGA